MQTPEPHLQTLGSKAFADAAYKSIRRSIQLVAVSYVFDAVVLALYAAMGWVTWGVVAGFVAAATTQFLMFDRAVGTGWSKRFRDPSLAHAHLAVGCSVQLVFIAIAPQVFHVFAFSCFAMVAFGTLQLTMRANLLAWLLLTSGVVAVFAYDPTRFGVPAATTAERVMLLFCWALALVRCSGIGSFGLLLREMVQRRHRQLIQNAKHLSNIAHRDALTGSLNRRGILAALESATTHARNGLALAMLDLDHFKQVNDQHGHPVGDAVLQQAANAITAALRTADTMGRYGGEEFLVLMHDMNDTDAVMRACERVRRHLAAQDWERIAPGLAQTVSIGVVLYRRGESMEETIARADAALYEAKRAGRDVIRMG